MCVRVCLARKCENAGRDAAAAEAKVRTHAHTHGLTRESRKAFLLQSDRQTGNGKSQWLLWVEWVCAFNFTLSLSLPVSLIDSVQQQRLQLPAHKLPKARRERESQTPALTLTVECRLSVTDRCWGAKRNQMKYLSSLSSDSLPLSLPFQLVPHLVPH